MHANYFETNFTQDGFLAHPSSPISQCNQSWPFEVIHVAWNKEIEGLAIQAILQVIHYQSHIRDSSKLIDLCDKPLWLGSMMDLPWLTFNLLQGIYVIYPCESMMDLRWLTFNLLQGIYMNYTFEYMMDLPRSIFNLLQGIYVIHPCESMMD